MADLFDDAVSHIYAEDARLGHQHGWSFLCTPRRTLANDAERAFITLNPGGRTNPPTDILESCEARSAYVHGEWEGHEPGTAPLQRQVRAMFAWLDLDPETTLSAYFIPFRSPSYSELVRKEESYRFGVRLWRTIFAEVQPRLVVCMGNDVESGLRAVWGDPVASSP